MFFPLSFSTLFARAKSTRIFSMLLKEGFRSLKVTRDVECQKLVVFGPVRDSTGTLPNYPYNNLV